MNTQEQKRLLMDLDISMRTVDCFYTVTFYGALFREVLGWWGAAGLCNTLGCVGSPKAQSYLKPPWLSSAELGCLR